MEHIENDKELFIHRSVAKSLPTNKRLAADLISTVYV